VEKAKLSDTRTGNYHTSRYRWHATLTRTFALADNVEVKGASSKKWYLDCQTLEVYRS
jgi:hypothetical protein